MQSLNQFCPNIAHQIWYQGETALGTRFSDYRASVRSANPEWTWLIHDADDLKTAVDRVGGKASLAYDAATVMHQRIDLGRLCLLHEYGGISVDMDMAAGGLRLRDVSVRGDSEMVAVALGSSTNNFGPFTSAFINSTTGRAPWRRLRCINNAIFACKPGSKAMREMIDVVSARLLNDTRLRAKVPRILRGSDATAVWRTTWAGPAHAVSSMGNRVYVVPQSTMEQHVFDDDELSIASAPPSVFSHRHTVSWMRNGVKKKYLMSSLRMTNSKFMSYPVETLVLLAIGMYALVLGLFMLWRHTNMRQKILLGVMCLIGGLGISLAVVAGRMSRGYSDLYFCMPGDGGDVKPMPRVIYRTWKTKNLADCPPNMQSAWYATERANPRIKQILFDDDDMDEFMRGMPDRWASAYFAIDKSYPAARADLWRYCICYTRGGVYLDNKSSAKEIPEHFFTDPGAMYVSTWPLSYLFHTFNPSVHLKFGYCGEMQQWWMACAPGHPVMKRVIEGVVSSIERESSQCSINNSTSLARMTRTLMSDIPIFSVTGPHAYTSAIMAASKSSSTTKSTATCNGFFVRGVRANGGGVFKYDHAGNHFRDQISRGHYSTNSRGMVQSCNNG